MTLVELMKALADLPGATGEEEVRVEFRTSMNDLDEGIEVVRVVPPPYVAIRKVIRPVRRSNEQERGQGDRRPLRYEKEERNA